MLFVTFFYILLVIYMISESDTFENAKSEDVYIVAHRGASGYASENTIAAFEKAIALKADYIEIDVRMTRDGELVVIHDPTIDRTTNGKGAVKSLTLEEIRKYDAGSWFHTCYSKERIPSLQEVLARYSKKIGLLIELRDPYLYPGIEKKLTTALRRAKLHHRNDQTIIIQSFDYLSIRRLHKLLPQIPKGLLTFSQCSLQEMRQISSFCHYINTSYFAIDQQYCKLLRDNGLKIFSWTVNHEDVLKRMHQAGVHGIITDFPDLFEKEIDKSPSPYLDKDQLIEFVQRAYQLFCEFVGK